MTFLSILASAAMAGLYVHGGAFWLLGFVFLVPWLRTLDASATVAGTLLRAYAMALAYTAAAFAWFGFAIGQYTQIGAATGLALLLLGAPLFQPQFFTFALVRHFGTRRYGPVLGALAGAAAWVATERLVPRLLGDTLGYGLYPSALLRQGAAVGGAAGLTLLLLLANEAVAAALGRHTRGWRALAKPLALAALGPLLLAAYGKLALTADPGPATKPLRMALIQSNFAAYESERKEKGAQAVVREVLDTHFAMSYDAVAHQQAEAVLWSETVYPTTFGHPKSEAGARFDREIIDFVNGARVPFVFGTYERDSTGEYNAAAFVLPETGLLGFYRKTHLFAFTEYVPSWLDGPLLRRLLPWTGNWRAGNGARVFPLQLADGREVPVLPLICRDDLEPGMAIDGARLGAQAILTMSNDAWFTAQPLGAELHQAAAAFRSIETGLPQFRVTSNGYSAVIDAAGTVLAGTRMGERTLVVGALPVRSVAPTLMVRWGDWVGLAACAFLAALAALAIVPAWQRKENPAPALAEGASTTVAVLPPAARIVAGILRSCARLGLLGICIAMLFNEALRTNTLVQVRTFAAWFLAPEAAAWCVLFLFSAQASVANGRLMLTRGARRLELALADVAAVHAWRLPLPCYGLSLQLASGERWRYGLAMASPALLAGALATAGVPLAPPRTVMQAYTQAALAVRRSRLDHPLAKFVLLPLALAIPAFHLHQQIAFGSPLGEYYSFGLRAYVGAFMLWWAAWAIGTLLSGALLRAAIETGTFLAVLLRPSRAMDTRLWLERLGHMALFLGLPAWLLMTASGR